MVHGRSFADSTSRKSPASHSPFFTLQPTRGKPQVHKEKKRKTPAMSGRRGRGRPTQADRLMHGAIDHFGRTGYAEADVRSTVGQLIEVPFLRPFPPLCRTRIPVLSTGFSNLKHYPRDRHLAGSIDVASSLFLYYRGFLNRLRSWSIDTSS